MIVGMKIGKGADNEPLIKNIKIIKELPFDYFRMDIKENRVTSTIEKCKHCC